MALVLVARESPDETGWFAYTPMSENDWSMEWDDGRQALFLSGWQLVGGAVGGLGLLVMASGLGYRLGRRSGRSD